MGSRNLKVLVVGAGIAGLSAAHFLACDAAQAGVSLDLSVLEAAGRAGGHIASEDVDGFLVEGGPDCFVSQKPWGLRLARELGLADAVTNTSEAASRTYVVSGGSLHPLPEGTMLMVPTRFLPMARSGLLTWPGKVRMGLDLVLPRGGQGDEALGAFVTRRLGHEATEKIAEPLVAGVHAGDPDKLSLVSTFPRFKDMEREHRSLIVAMVRARRKMAEARRLRPADAPPPPSAFITLAGGLESMVDALGAGLPAGALELGVTAVELHRDRADREWSLQVRTRDGDLQERRADAVVLAVPAHEAAAILRSVAPSLSAELGSIAYVSAATVSVGFRREQVGHPLDGFGMVIPRSEGRPIMGVTWSSSKFPGRAPADSVLVRAFVGGVKGPEVLTRPDEEVVRLVRREIADLLGTRGEPVFTRLYRWDRAMPQYEVGHGERLARIDAHLAALQGVVLAGGAYRGIGIPDCIASGRDAADTLLDTSPGASPA